MSTWINVNDELPPKKDSSYQVIALSKKKHNGGNYNGEPKRVICQDWTVRSWQDNFTHWRQCEPLPNEKSDGNQEDGMIDGIISESGKLPQSSIDPTKPFPQSGTWVGSETKRTAVIDNPCELCGEEISKPYDFKVCENCYHKSMSER